MEEPESGSQIDVWIGATESTRKRFTAWYDPTRQGYVLESGVFAMDMRMKMEDHYTTGPAVKGACTVARFLHTSPPYGPQCLLPVNHPGKHLYESDEDDNSEILS
jgi:hypothetical protein